MSKPRVSVRIGEKVIRFTVNPVLLALSVEYVDWAGVEPESGKLGGAELVEKARKRFPSLPLSWAVEGYLALLLKGDELLLKPFDVEAKERPDKSMRRFGRYSPSEKIRVVERWKRQLNATRRSK